MVNNPPARRIPWTEEPGGLQSYDHRESDRLVIKSESESEVAQSCLTLCNLVDCSLPGSSVHGIFQATVLKRVTISLSRGSSQPRDGAQVSRVAGRCFTI